MKSNSKYCLPVILLLNRRDVWVRLFVITICFALGPLTGVAQLSLTNIAPSALIDFSGTMPTSVGTNPSTAYTGVGLSPNPVVAGRLNSNAWSVFGFSDGDVNYGGTNTTGDFARGATAAAVTTGGLYAFTGAPGSIANPALMIQPSSAPDFAPGTLTLRLINNGSTIITSMTLSYNLFVRNDQARSSTFNFSYSSDNFINSDFPVVPLNYTSTAAADALGWVQVSRSTNITGIYVPPGSYFYLRWVSADVAGSGSRDEFGLDDINITATYSAPCTQPGTQAVITSITGILSSQLSVNYTRGNGTGGVLIVASTSATLSSNPTSGNVYGANTNFGNGDPLGGGFVVYNGTGTGVNNPATVIVTGLAPSTLYHFFIFEYAVTVPCYMVPGNSGSETTAAGSATSPTDYFRSRATGNWNVSNTWESSPDNATWITATIPPTFLAKGILIVSPHIVTITSTATAKLLNIAAGATLTYTNQAAGGWDLDIAADPLDVDFKIFGTYFLYGIAPTLGSSSTVQVYNGGLVKVDGNVGMNTSDDFARNPLVSFATGSVYQWNYNLPFQSSSAVYFPNASTTDIATFRLTQPLFNVGANSTTEIKGLFEANGNINFVFAGAKIFRNGIIGTGAVSQSSAGPFIIDGATAVLGGTGTINLFNGSGLTIATNSVTTLISNKTINTAGGLTTVDGILYCAANIISGSSNFTVSNGATLGIGSTGGISAPAGATGNIQVTGLRTFNAAANYLYNSTVANQITGNGLPGTLLAGGSLIISNTAGVGNNTVTLTTNNTTTPVLSLVNGLFEAGNAQFLRITAGGTVIGTGGNQGQSAAAGTIQFLTPGIGIVNPVQPLSLTNVLINDGVNMGGFKTRINGILNIDDGGYVLANSAPTYSSTPASTLLYSCSCNYNAGNEWYPDSTGTRPGVPHNVTLAPGASLNFGSANTREMRGDLIINSGSTFALSTTNFSDFNIMGNWTRNVGGNFDNNNRAVRFNGTTADQTITVTGGGSDTFAYILINKASGRRLIQANAPNPTNILLNGAGGSNTLQLINGDLDINGQVFNFTSYFNGFQNNFGIDGSLGNLTRNVLSTSAPGTFAVFNSNALTRNITINRLSANASTLVFGTGVSVTTGGIGPGGGGINFGNTLSTINGTLQINTYGYVTGFAPTYGTNSFLVYNSSGSFDRNVEWGAITGPGYPWNVVVQNNTNISLNFPAANGSADRAIAGNLSIVPGSSLLLSTTAGNKLTVGGNLVLSGDLILPTAFGGDLYIGGNFNRSSTGSFTPNDRAVFFYGSTNSTITADGGQLFPYLYMTKNSLAQTVTLLDSISISNEFKITGGTFDPADRDATLLSTPSATASFGKVGIFGAVTYSGTGRFVVERYIPTGTLAGQHIKSWQFLAVPDNGGQTINEGWQEGYVLPVVGISNYGTILSNNNGGAGFDINAGVGPSIKTFVPATGTWAGVPNTTATPLFNKKGYFVLVRGDRNVSTFDGTPTPTTLRSRGTLFVPSSNPPLSTNVPAGSFETIGNPYASAIDFLNISRPGAPDLDSTFYVWDPLLYGSYNLGGFQTISSTNGYKPNPGGTANYSNAVAYTKIESGQAFMVHATGAGGTVSFAETAKIDGSEMVFRPPNGSSRQYFRAALYTGSGQIADANVVSFDRAFSNNYDSRDALKFLNSGENFDIASNHKTLAVEARQPVVRTDTIHYALTNLRNQAYQFRFGAENMAFSGITAFLEDRFLRTSTAISLGDSSYIDFSLTSDPASRASDRFIVVFKKKPRMASSNPPVIDTAKDLGVKSGVNDNTSRISVYPNPVVDKLIRLVVRNKPAGNYKFQLINNGGQIVKEGLLVVSGLVSAQQIRVSTLPAGYYRLKLISNDAEETSVPVVLEN